MSSSATSTTTSATEWTPERLVDLLNHWDGFNDVMEPGDEVLPLIDDTDYSEEANWPHYPKEVQKDDDIQL